MKLRTLPSVSAQTSGEVAGSAIGSDKEAPSTGKRGFAVTLRAIRRMALYLSGLVIFMGIGYFLGERGIVFRLGVPPQAPVVSVVNREVPLQHRDVDFSLFWQVWEELERSYLKPDAIDEEKMVHGAISGMTAALGDPYTVFLPPLENQQTKENLSGSFYGIGIQIGYKDHQLTVIAPLKNMPAEKAGVMAGDMILRIIDKKEGVDRDTQGLPLPEAVSLIRGEQGTEVTLSLLREGMEEPFEKTIVRREIVIPSVELEFVQRAPTEEGTAESEAFVAHLQVFQFGERTKEEWESAVGKVLSRKSEIVGVVLDLRNNPGGYLSGSVDLASEFLRGGVVVVQQGRLQSETFQAGKEGRLVGIPVIVLVNKGSASASEIVAGALRDRLGAKIVGEQTFGKGTVQEARDLSEGAGLHVTTSRWILPSGTEINDRGLKPDFEVEDVAQGEGEEPVDEQLEKAMEVLSEQS